MNKVLMEEMTSPEFARTVKDTDTVIIPVGSTEVLGTRWVFTGFPLERISLD